MARERPIMFSAPMVRAILARRKSQTRRVRGLEDVNNEPDAWDFNRVDRLDYKTRKPFKGRFGAYFQSARKEPGSLLICPTVCPHGAPGDTLWVKEAWRCPKPMDADCGSVLGQKVLDAGWERPWVPIQYQVDGARDNWDSAIHGSEVGRYRHARYMPRWASRITLEVTGVRVERAQDITEADACAEGVAVRGDPRDNFRLLWDSINAKRGYGWDVNPWTWRVSFRRTDA